MAERTRKILLPRIRQSRIITQAKMSAPKSLKRVIDRKYSRVNTEEMKGDYFYPLINEDHNKANHYRYKTQDIEDVLIRRSHKNIKNPFNGMEREKVRSTNTLKHKERESTPSVLEQIVKNHTLTQADIHLSQQMQNYSTISQSFQNFVAIISRGNQLLQRTSIIIIKSLLKLGNILVYLPRQLIYAQQQPVRRIGFILWGQAVLKKRKKTQRLNCLPGYGIGQQLIFERKEYNSQKMLKVEKGQFLTMQKCKACSNCGVLFIDGKQYSMMCQQLARQGYKDIISKFQSLLFRTYLKKRQFRNVN